MKILRHINTPLWVGLRFYCSAVAIAHFPLSVTEEEIFSHDPEWSLCGAEHSIYQPDEAFMERQENDGIQNTGYPLKHFEPFRKKP
jgi:hypothetical protein